MNIWKKLNSKLTSSVFMLMVLPEFNPLDMTFRQVRTFIESPNLGEGNMTGGLTQGMPEGYMWIAGISAGIILFSISSVYFHSRKKQKGV